MSLLYQALLLFCNTGRTCGTLAFTTACIALFAMPQIGRADVKLPAVFSDHAVLQRDMPVPVWGTAEAGEAVTVMIAGQTHKTKGDDTGHWRVTLQPLKVGAPLRLVVEGKNRLQRIDLLVGDVWLCSGQSNMEWEVGNAFNGDLDMETANYPQIRMLTIDTPASQTPLEDFDDTWHVCSPETVETFSAVGYYFGREIYEHVHVPIGLIDNSWGGSACEAWIPREKLEGNPLYEPLLKRWDKRVADFKAASAAASAPNDAPSPPAARVRAGRDGRGVLSNPLGSQVMPANLYNSRIRTILPFAIRGTIWYQGEENADRAYQYREMFPLMVKTWREEWKQGDFPFYWAQLADYMDESEVPGESAWAELREAQSMALEKIPNSGQAVIIDLGDTADIHPRNKFDVARRLARIALARDYGREELVYRSPRFESMEIQGDRILLRFKDVDRGLKKWDNERVQGFAIAGSDRAWVWCEARIVAPDQVQVRSDAVPDPIAVRYAWSDNPVANLYNMAGLPVTPFRTDDWTGVTAEKK